MTFECKVCLTSPVDLRIYQCPKGHSICEKCIIKIFTRAQGGGQAKCPECRSVYPPNPVRNFGLEQALSTGTKDGQNSRPPFSAAEVGLGAGQRNKQQEDLVDNKTMATAAVTAVAGVGVGLLGAWLFGGGNKERRRQQ